MSNTTSLNSVIFDLDGVVTKTALVHAESWKVMFDEYLKLREERDGLAFKEFTYENDYLVYVDGKPRYKGVQSFLESREIFIDFGDPEDAPGQETVCGLGNRKNTKFREVLEASGVDEYPSTVTLIKELHQKGVPVGVASSSKNCQFVLQSAGIEALFLTRVDGVVSAELGLNGKPEGDIFVRACENLGCDPAKSVVVEDAVAGVKAGVAGKFGLVVGIARENNIDELKAAGADVVIEDFEGYDVAALEKWLADKQS